MRHLTRFFMLWLFLLTPVNSEANAESLTRDLQLVGQARLNYLFWTIYDSRLYTRQGYYQGIEPDLVLEITYQRKVTASQLVESTRKEWQALGVYRQKDSESWLEKLRNNWPDVDKGDVLTLRVGDDLTSHFYFNGQAIGSIREAKFTHHFLAIWLSPDARHSRQQRQLTGG